MSLIPFVPFPHSRRVDAPLAQLHTATLRGLTVYPSASQRDVFYFADPIQLRCVEAMRFQVRRLLPFRPCVSVGAVESVNVSFVTSSRA